MWIENMGIFFSGAVDFHDFNSSNRKLSILTSETANIFILFLKVKWPDVAMAFNHALNYVCCLFFWRIPPNDYSNCSTIISYLEILVYYDKLSRHIIWFVYLIDCFVRILNLIHHFSNNWNHVKRGRSRCKNLTDL